MGRKNKRKVTKKKSSDQNGIKRSKKEVVALSEAVFGNDLVLKTILTFALQDEDGCLSTSNLCNVRLVSKSWMDTASHILRVNPRSTINLELDEVELNDETQRVAIFEEETGSTLDQFVMRFTGPESLPYSALPFSLKMELGYFRMQNYQSLANCFIRNGDFLTKLNMTIPQDGGSMPFDFCPSHLPRLRELSFHFSSDNYVTQPNEYQTFGNNTNSIALLQSLMTASKQLEVLKFPYNGTSGVPANFGSITLARSIKTLVLDFMMKSRDLDILMQNELPNLSFLKLQLRETPFRQNLPFQVLQRHEATLTHLEIIGLKSNGTLRPVIPIRFPRMNVLKNLGICSAEFEILNSPKDLQSLFPSLKHLDLNLNKHAMSKWMCDSIYDTVTDLQVCIMHSFLPEDDDLFYRSFCRRMLCELHNAFPNVTRLGINFNAARLYGLKYIFKHMTALRDLEIVIRGDTNSLNSSHIDSVMLGIPLQLAVVLKQCDQLIKSVEFEEGAQLSILNLAELRYLSLWATMRPDDQPVADCNSLTSKLFVLHGIRKLRNLEEIILNGKFDLTQESFDTWQPRCEHRESSKATCECLANIKDKLILN